MPIPFRVSHALLALLLIGSLSASARAQEDPPEEFVLKVKVGKLPAVEMTPRPPPTEAQKQRIKGLIASLAQLEGHTHGLSPTISSVAFDPIEGQERAFSLLLTNHGLKTSETIKTLVSLGPQALPFVLEALSDKTPTKIKVEHGGGFGVMYYGGELPGNPANPLEQPILKARWKNRDKDDGHVPTHTVTIGDVCFVILGQIVGRSYQAVRYQPSGCIVVNSPTQDAKLLADLRTIWGSDNALRKHWDMLVMDYATEGIHDPESVEGHARSSEWQCGTALRLLYYYPKESVPLLAERLNRLTVHGDKKVDYKGKVQTEESHAERERRMAVNRVDEEEFIKAVVWSKDPAIQEALAGILRRTDDVDVFLATLPGVTDKELLRSRLEAMLVSLPKEQKGDYGSGYHLLLAFGQRLPELAKPAFQRYLQDASIQRKFLLCRVLQRVKVPFDKDILVPLLVDKDDEFGRTYVVHPDQPEVRRNVRVCDEAAKALAAHYPDLKFRLEGMHPDLDKQIRVLRNQLERR